MDFVREIEEGREKEIKERVTRERCSAATLCKEATEGEELFFLPSVSVDRKSTRLNSSHL